MRLERKGNWRNCSGVKWESSSLNFEKRGDWRSSCGRRLLCPRLNLNSVSSERHGAVRNGSAVEFVYPRLRVSSFTPATLSLGMSSSNLKGKLVNKRCFKLGVDKN